MQKNIFQAAMLIVVSAAILAQGCRQTPVTNRRQFIMIPQATETEMGATSFRQILDEEPLSENQLYIDDVNRVGERLAAVAGQDYQWDFQVIASPDQNAFALPGGKVAVYEGIMPLCESEAGLATVISHEIAHIICRHGGERMSQEYAVNGAGILIKKWAEDKDEIQQERIAKIYGVGSKYGALLPYSRTHELEADYIGMVLMARAGYDPAEAGQFWERMTKANAGQAPMEFMSTHPSDGRRIDELKRRVPEAVAEAEKVSDTTRF